MRACPSGPLTTRPMTVAWSSPMRFKRSRIFRQAKLDLIDAVMEAWHNAGPNLEPPHSTPEAKPRAATDFRLGGFRREGEVAAECERFSQALADERASRAVDAAALRTAVLPRTPRRRVFGSPSPIP